MNLSFLQPQTVAALKAVNRIYSQQFTLGASTDGVTPVTTGSDAIVIQSGHHFFTEALSLGFPTVTGTGGEEIILDDYVCRQTLLLKTNQLSKLFSEPVLLSMIGVPGRQPFANAVDAAGNPPPPGQAPHISGWAFNAFLAAGTDFYHTFSNISTTPGIIVSVVWQGWDFLDTNIPNAEAFWKIVSKYQDPPFVN